VLCSFGCELAFERLWHMYDVMGLHYFFHKVRMYLALVKNATPFIDISPVKPPNAPNSSQFKSSNFGT